MKNIILLFLLINVIVSCYGSKKAINQESKETIHIETPVVVETNVDSIYTQEINKEPISSPKVSDIIQDIVIKDGFNHSVFNELLLKHVSNQGKVNYSGFKADRKYLISYINTLGNNIPDNVWTREAKLAYWINAYNALTIDLIIRNPEIKSIKDIKDPWNQRLWKLGEKWYNLDEIEHQILRKMNEPRIHFAIVCASVSCPKLQNKAFTASELDNQLNNATREFLSDPSKNNLSSDRVELSRIFKWFAKDFKQGQTLIGFLNRYSDIEISQKASINFKDYDWDLND